MGYCSKCGQQLNGGAGFCSRCGTKVSSVSTSSSGNSGVIYIRRGKRFPITSQASVSFSAEMRDFIEICAPFEKEAKIKKGEFRQYIDTQARGFEWLYHVAFSTYNSNITNILSGLGLKTLLNKGVNSYSSDMLINGFADFAGGSSGDLKFQQFLGYKQSVEDFADQIASKRNIQRSSRSYWQGGGFGLKGALCGKIKADLLNMGTNAIRGIGDSIVDSRDRAAIEEYMDNCYSSAVNTLCCSHYDLLCNAGAYIYCLLVREGVFKPVDFLASGQLKSSETMSERAGAKIGNIYNAFCRGDYSKEQTIEKLCECISEYPYHMHAHRDIYKIDKSTKQNLTTLTDYCGTKGSFMDWVHSIDNGKF